MKIDLTYNYIKNDFLYSYIKICKNESLNLY